MKQVIFNCLASLFCGVAIGLWFGLYDNAGHIYYSVADGIRAAGLLGTIFVLASIVSAYRESRGE